MAETIGLAIFAAAGTTAAEVGATFAVSATVAATVVGASATLLAGVAVNAVASAITDQQKVAAQQFQSRQPIPVRQRSYGRVKLGGSYVQYKSYNGSFYYGLYHGEGPWDAVEEVWLDDQKSNVGVGLSGVGLAAGGGVVTVVPWRSYVAVQYFTGTDSQSASSLLAQVPGWDGSHTLKGCVYTAVQSRAPPQNKFKNYYPKNSWPSARVVGRTNKVRMMSDGSQTEDPSTWRWTDLAAPCIRDLLVNQKWGMRVPVTLVSSSRFLAFEQLCAQTVVSKDGTSFPRYFLGGTYQMTDDPTDVLKRMLDTCDGRLTLEPDGTIGITGGRAPTPTVTLDDDDFISMLVEADGSKLLAFNRLKITYVSPLHDYQQVEGQPWDNSYNQGVYGELLEEDFSRPWVQNFNQVRRLAKIYDAKSNPAYKVSGVCKLSAAAALFEEAVYLDSKMFPLFRNLIFYVSRAVANVEAGTVTLELSSLDPGAYTFNAAVEEGTAPALPNTNATSAPPAVPQNLTVSVVRQAVSGSINTTVLRLVCSPPSDRSDLSLIGRYRLVNTADWTDMVQDTDNQYSLVSAVLTDGGQYEVQGAMSGFGKALVSDYIAASPSPITAVADPNAPASPYNLSARGTAGSATVTWNNGNSSNYAATKLYVSSSSDYSTASLVATVGGAQNDSASYSPGLTAGVYFFWVVGVNASGTSTGPVGPSQVTVT